MMAVVLPMLNDFIEPATLTRMFSGCVTPFNDWITDEQNTNTMTEEKMILTLIDCIEKMNAAKVKYEKHPGGGASQKIKNKLAKEYGLRTSEMNNAVFNIKQLIK